MVIRGVASVRDGPYLMHCWVGRGISRDEVNQLLPDVSSDVRAGRFARPRMTHLALRIFWVFIGLNFMWARYLDVGRYNLVHKRIQTRYLNRNHVLFI